eukprot:649246-Prymnesium_polylepis.1
MKQRVIGQRGDEARLWPVRTPRDATPPPPLVTSFAFAERAGNQLHLGPQKLGEDYRVTAPAALHAALLDEKLHDGVAKELGPRWTGSTWSTNTHTRLICVCTRPRVAPP